VKARSSEKFGWPEESVHYFKRRALIRLAQWYLQAHPRLGASAVRFDVVSLLLDPQGKPLRTRLILNAFQYDS
jgi:putative endonuclease